MQTSKLSSKSQIVLPKQIREALGVRPGDTIAYEIDSDVVRIKRLEPFDAAFYHALSSTLSEWADLKDEEAFRDI